MATKIVTKNSSTASAVPTASDLVQGELAVNVADKRLFTEDNGGSIIELGTNPSTIDINAGSIDGTAIGASSASTGAFTTLTASGAFTSVGIDDNATSTAITIDSSENVGIGVVPESWTYFSPLQAKRSSFAGSDGQTGVGYNWYFDGAYKYIANDYALAYQQNATSGVHSWSTAASGTAGATATLTERMRIDSSGNVGIGTSSPISKMQVSGANNGDVFYLTSSDVEDDRGLMFSNSTNGIIWDLDAKGASSLFGQMTFSTNGTERMRIDSSGHLNIGVSTAINSSGNTADGFTFAPNSGYAWLSVSDIGGIYVQRQDDNAMFSFYRATNNVGSIRVTSSATSYNTTSDYRLKENVVELTGATERLKQLNPSRFNFIADADTTVDGFLAHEVADVVPEAISGEKDAMKDEEYEVTPAVLDEEGNVVTEAVMGTRSVPDYQGIDQSKLVPLLVATIQELEARITELENS